MRFPTKTQRLYAQSGAGAAVINTAAGVIDRARAPRQWRARGPQ